MDKEQVIALAREAGMYVHTEVQKELLAFAALVAAAQKEECAKVLDEMAAQDKHSNYYVVAARAIRAGGNT